MEDKKSFLLYANYWGNISRLNIEQRGILFTAIYSHVRGDELPEMDGATDMAFGFIQDQLERDTEKYNAIVEKRREAGKRGGRPKANGSEDKAKKANGSFEKQSKAKKPDNDNVNDNDNDNVNDNDIKEKKERKKKSAKAPEVAKPYFPSDDLLNKTFLEFIEHRKAMKKPMTEIAISKMINKLNKYSRGIAIASLDKSMENGWQGVFPEKESEPSGKEVTNGQPATNNTEIETDDSLYGKWKRGEIDTGEFEGFGDL